MTARPINPSLDMVVACFLQATYANQLNRCMLVRSGSNAGDAYCSVRSSVAATAVIGAAMNRRPFAKTAFCCARR